MSNWKLRNLGPSLIALVVILVGAAALGWAITFLLGMEVKGEGGADPSGQLLFTVRALVGMACIGIWKGIEELFRWFSWCMRYESKMEG